MKRPTLFILIYIIGGILLEQYFKGYLKIALFSVSIFFITFLIHIKFKSKKSYFLLIFFILGFLLTKNQMNINNNYINKNVELTCIVNNLKTTSGGYQKFYGKVFEVNNKKEKFTISVISISKNQIKNNDIIKIYGKIENLDNPKNNQDYNEFLYERSQGATVKILSTNFNKIGERKNFFYFLNFFREKLANNYDKLFQENEASIIKAMILGDKDNLSDKISELYKIGGIYHILAISGMHIGILSAFIYFVFKKFFNKKASSMK